MEPPVYPTARYEGPHGGLQLDKQKVGKVTDSVDSNLLFIQWN